MVSLRSVFGRIEGRSDFLGNHQMGFVTGVAPAASKFHEPQADDVIRLKGQHRRRIPGKHCSASWQRRAA
jgi:hypothetical protein